MVILRDMSVVGRYCFVMDIIALNIEYY